MTHRFPSTLFAALLLALPTSRAPAQDRLPTNPTLEAAILVEEGEFDDAKALERYRAVEADEGQPEAIRRHAALRIGQLLLRSSDDRIDAAREALERAAGEADDAVARAARELLEAPRPDLEREAALERQAVIRLGRFQQGGGNVLGAQIDVLQDLHWIGPAGSRAIVSELQSFEVGAWSSRNQSSRNQIVQLLWTTGGPSARTFLLGLLGDMEFGRGDNPDGRAALKFSTLQYAARGLQWFSTHRADLFAEDLRPVAAAYTAHPIADIQHAALSAYRVLPLEALLAGVNSPIESVRPVALRSLNNRLRETAVDEAEYLVAIDLSLTALTGAFDSVDPDVREAAGQLVGQHGMQTRTGRRTAIENSGSEALQANFGTWWPEELTPATAREEAKILLDRIGGRPADAISSQEARILQHVAAVEFSRLTGNEDLETVVSLTLLGYLPESNLESWLFKHAGDGDIDRVLAELGEATDLAFSWLARRDLPAASWSTLRAHVPDPDALGDGTPWPDLSLTALARTGAAEANAYFAALLVAERRLRPTNTQLFVDLHSALLHLSHRRDDEASRALLREFLEPPYEPNQQRLRIARSACLARLVQLGDEPIVARMVEEPRILQEEEYVPQPTPEWMRGPLGRDTRMLRAYFPADDGVHHWHGYTDGQLPRVWRTALQGIDPVDEDAWISAGHLLGVPATKDGSSRNVIGTGNNNIPCPEAPFAFPSELLTTIATLATSQVRRPDASFHFGLQNATLRLVVRREQEQLEAASAEAVDQLVLALLDAKDDQLRELGVLCLAHYDGDAWTARLFDALVDPSPETANAALSELAARQVRVSAESYRRAIEGSPIASGVMSRLAAQVDGDVATLIAPFTTNESPITRRRACNALGTRLETAGVPALLRALGDPDDDVRTAARQSLEAIRFHQEQKAHWDAVFSGTAELGRSKAAARLVAQAAADQPKQKRLLAIQALGALGEPEALPFLITWTEDPDAEIAKAAQDATTRLLK